MSLEIPKVAVAFGSVTPPQGDVLELRVHLGCTKEVSSFECMLQNFDGKYTVTNPINVGDGCSISIGRGDNVPLILTGRVEEVEPESTPVENYIRVRGRCWGEKIFRRVVTKTYENQKGEAIVKDLLDNYIGLSHVRDGTELVENTDTTYTLLEYENTPVFDILKYIAESADKAGAIGFDFRVDWDGRFAFFPKNSKNSPISLSEKIEHSRYSKDIHRVRNKIKVYGAAEKPYPLDTDGQPWSDSLTEDLTKPDNYLQHADGKWEPDTPNTNLYIDTVIVHTGSKSVKLECTAYIYYMGILFTFNSDKYVDCNRYPRLCFTLREDSNHNKSITISLEDKDGNVCRQTLSVADYDEWQSYELGIGKQNQGSWTMSVFNSGPFDWENLKKVRLDFHQLSSKHGVAFIDRMHFGGCRWSGTEEDSGSESSYGLRELVEVDEELHSDNECSLRAKALLDHLSQPAEALTLRTTCLDYGNNRLLPGDNIHVTLPNENIDSDFRIISVEYRVSARDQTLEMTLELGKEKPLLADYLYGLRSTTITVEKLMRTKAGLTGIAGGGGGGGGGGMVQHGNEWHDPDFSETDEKVKVSSTDTTPNHLAEKLLAGEGITLTKKNSGADEDLEIGAHRKWGWADEGSFDGLVAIPYSRSSGWVKYVGNPVIRYGGTGWRQVGVQAPCLRKRLVEDYTYWAFVAGIPTGETWRSKYIGVFKSNSLIGPWIEGSNNPLISYAAGTWKAVLVVSPAVIYDRWETDPTKRWKMWFIGASTTPTEANSKIGYAYASSPQGPFTEYAGNPVFAPTGGCRWALGVIRFQRLFYLIYAAADGYSLKCAYSADGITWVNWGTILERTATAWDDMVDFATIWWNLGVWYIFYAGWLSPYNNIGMATSYSGFRIFDKWVENPVLQYGASWEAGIVCKPSVIMEESSFHMLYRGGGAGGYARQIGYAYLPAYEV